MEPSRINKELNDRVDTASDVAALTLSRKQSKKERRSSFMNAVSKANSAYKQDIYKVTGDEVLLSRGRDKESRVSIQLVEGRSLAYLKSLQKNNSSPEEEGDGM